MKLYNKIIDSVKDGEITVDEITDIVAIIKTLDLKQFKKILQGLILASMFIPALKPYVPLMQSVKSLLDGNVVFINGLSLEEIFKLFPKLRDFNLSEAITMGYNILEVMESFKDTGKENKIVMAKE